MFPNLWENAILIQNKKSSSDLEKLFSTAPTAPTAPTTPPR